MAECWAGVWPPVFIQRFRMGDDGRQTMRAKGKILDYTSGEVLWENEEFKQLPIEFRVAAIMSDGQYYTADKVRMLCQEKPGFKVKPILEDMVGRGELCAHPNGVTFYMTLKQLKSWREANSVSLTARPIRKIVAPRIFGEGEHQCTENELFLRAPLHQVGTVTFTLTDPFVINEMRSQLGWMGEFKMENEIRGKLYCLAAAAARQRMLKFEEEQGGHVFQPGRCTTHNVSMRRELCELDKSAVTDLVQYYTKFARKLVPYIGKTFNTYMGAGPGNTGRDMSPESKADVAAESDAIIMSWIVNLVQKFDESSGYPFSVYLQRVVPNFVYDYAVKQVGPEVNKFQIEKNKAIKRLNKANGNPSASVYYSTETIRRDMAANGFRITREEYLACDSSLDSWRKLRKPAVDLNWDDGEEKQIGGGYDPAVKKDPFDPEAIADLDRRHRVQAAIISAGMDSGEYAASVKTMRLLSDSRSLAMLLMSGDSLDLPDSFKESLAVALSHSQVD